MRVLMLSWEYPPYVQGGLGRHVSELVPALGRQPGVELHLVVPRFNGGSPREIQQNVIVHRIDAPVPARENFHGGVWHVNNLMSAAVEQLWTSVGGFDIIHAHDWLVGFVAGALHRNYGTPLVVTFHATERGRGRGWLGGDLAYQIDEAERNLAHSATRIITCSNSMRNEVSAYFGIDKKEIDVIPNGVNTTPYDRQNAQNNDLQRQMYALPDEALVFHVGRLVHEKGAPILLEAIPRVLEAFPNTKFVIAGRGPLLEILKQRATVLNVRGRVLFPGFISDDEVIRLYCVADLAVFPSLYEPFGLVALEAMAAKTPLVVTGIGGLGEVVTHGVTALTVYAEDVDSLTWGIKQVLGDPISARERAQKAYVVAQQCYGWLGIAAQDVDLYRSLLETAETQPEQTET